MIIECSLCNQKNNVEMKPSRARICCGRCGSPLNVPSFIMQREKEKYVSDEDKSSNEYMSLLKFKTIDKQKIEKAGLILLITTLCVSISYDAIQRERITGANQIKSKEALSPIIENKDVNNIRSDSEEHSSKSLYRQGYCGGLPILCFNQHTAVKNDETLPNPINNNARQDGLQSNGLNQPSDQKERTLNPFLDAENNFNALDETSRIDQQLKLMAIGYLTSVPNKKYSRRLYEAICKFQKYKNIVPSGILGKDDVTKLNDESVRLFQLWNFQKTDILPLGRKLLVPFGSELGLKLSTVEDGIVYKDDDLNLFLLYQSFPSNDIRWLSEQIIETSEKQGESVEYKVIKTKFFAFKSKNAIYGNSTYGRFHLDQDRVIGFIFKWKADGPKYYPERLVNILSSSLYAEMTNEIELRFPENKNNFQEITHVPTRGQVNEQQVSGIINNPIKSQGNNFIDNLEQSNIGRSDIPLIKDAEGLKVSVNINGVIKLNFIVDTGASDVSIPADVVLVMMRAGTLSESDFIGTKKYRLADGSIVPSKTFWIRKLTVGNRTIENVQASMSDVNATPLLGQSFLSRFAAVSLDYNKRVLMLQ